MKRALGIDISDVRVRRGEEVSLAARYLGARAFTADEVVHLPDSAGPVEGGDAAPLLAHELTHAAQQRHFGAALPGPETAAGRRLEAEAVTVQQWVAEGMVGEPPVVRGHSAPVQLAREDYDDLDDEPDDDFDEDINESDLDKARRVKRLQRQVDRDRGGGSGFQVGWDEIPDLSLSGILNRRGSTAGEPEGWHEVPDVSPQGIRDMAERMRRDVQEPPPSQRRGGVREPPGDGPGPGQGQGPSAGEESPALSLAEVVEKIAENPPRRWMDLDDPDHFEEISNRVYNCLLPRLRFDVLVERERSGTLMDFR